MRLIRSEADFLLSLYPSEFIVHNILCIILKFIREEAQKLAFDGKEDLTGFDSLDVSIFMRLFLIHFFAEVVERSERQQLES